ncbi:hypothetical protein HY771_01695 [Candidatus Uhrbacteria bacterium]|nr:hypothetical protein [Candidatus Uhrbacteria bacterium]MBI4812361.1 hypothetical protein [Candidatus Falkowbacteria bacterium]
MKKTILGIIIVIVLGLLGWYIYVTLKPAEEKTSQIPSINPQSNPVEEKIPELNPVEETNPFGGSYKNPFKK